MSKLINDCLNILRRDDIKNELKTFSLPIINICFEIIKPYIYCLILLLLIIFIILCIMLFLLVQLIKNKYSSYKYCVL
jgi:hypothetical protein